MRKPPLMPYLLLRCFAPKDIREFFLGDIEEEFQTLATDQGQRQANRWVWRQSLVSVIPIFGLIVRKNLNLSPFRMIAFFAVVVPVLMTQPLRNGEGSYFSLSQLVGLLFSALALGFLCRLIVHNIRFLTSVTIALVIFTILLIVRGDSNEIPWLIVLAFGFISIGVGLALFTVERNTPGPKIRA